jgi:biopolymer transport protein ExbB/TolQ
MLIELGDKQAHAERAYRLMNTEANSEIDCLDSNLSILAMIAAMTNIFSIKAGY